MNDSSMQLATSIICSYTIWTVFSAVIDVMQDLSILLKSHFRDIAEQYEPFSTLSAVVYNKSPHYTYVLEGQLYIALSPIISLYM